MATKEKRRDRVIDPEINTFFLTIDELVKLYQLKTFKQRIKFVNQLNERKR